MSALLQHLAGGCTTTCLAWAVTRQDGETLGFTDHDRDLSFDGVVFRAGTGLTAQALQQVSGLAVDNTEALGALSDASIRAEDLRAGRYDGAKVRCWLVNWQDPAARQLRFAGTIGEVGVSGAAFRAELRGVSEALNQMRGRRIQAGCDAVLGDSRCGFDLAQPGYGTRATILALREGRILALDLADGFAPGWFQYGPLRFLDGAAAGLAGTVKADRIEAGGRTIELWQEPGVTPAPGDQVHLAAGCNRLAATCREKFRNFQRFRGFPHVPGEDWITTFPRRDRAV